MPPLLYSKIIPHISASRFFRTFIVFLLTSCPFTALISPLAAESAPPEEELKTANEKIEKLNEEIKKADEIKAAAEAKKLAIREQLEKGLRDLKELDPNGWSFNYQLLKPSTRVYFDIGEDDAGEIDLFKDGEFGLSLDFVTFSADWSKKGFTIGPFASGGISSASGDATSSSVVLMWSAGVAITHSKIPVALEIGFMGGISADERLNSTQRDDTALFIGISLSKILGKKPLF